MSLHEDIKAVGSMKTADSIEMFERIDRILIACEEMEKALEQYADMGAYSQDPETFDANYDCGTLARECLRKVRGE